jgi:glycosyltransferase involved in cell wall biosynthesis
MNTAIVTTCQHPCAKSTGWGAEKYIFDLVECLNQKGHEVTIFATENSQIPENGRLIVCKNEDVILSQYSYLFKFFDIIHDFSATKKVHDYCQNLKMRSIAANFNTHFLFPEIHKNVVCVSEAQKQLGLMGKSGFENTPWEKMVGNTGQLKCDAKIVYLGINLDNYKPEFKKEDFILYLNSYDYRKGITLTLDLAKSMGFNLIVAGSTQHPEHTETFRILKPIMDSMPNVKYFTDITNEQKIELMQKAKALLFPSLFHQPFAIVVLEALACGTPVITTNMGAMPEMIEHGNTGFLCNNMNELSQSINSINTLSNTNCRMEAVKRFDRKIMAEEYIKLYEQILNGEEW